MSNNHTINNEEIFYNLLQDNIDNDDVVLSRLIRSQILYEWISQQIVVLSQSRKKKKK